MPHPKRRHSSIRRDKRRTHDSISLPKLVKCPVTDTWHLPHRAFWYESKMYYKGRVVIDNTKAL